MIYEISVDTPYDIPENVLHCYKLCLIVSKAGPNSGDLDALGFYFYKLKLHKVKLTTKV